MGRSEGNISMMPANTSGGAIALDDLIALSDEMAALSKSGVPLERGLLNLGQEIPGELGRTTRRLAQRLERGESLDQALAAEEGSFPRVYRTVVQAGLKAGHLPTALEGLAVAARRLAELRRAVGLAIVYPLVVFLLAYGLFVFFIMHMAPELQKAYDGFQIARHPLLDGLARLGETVVWWGPIAPTLVLVLGIIWWRQSGRAMLVNPGRTAALFGWIPWVGKLLLYSRAAMFAEVLALLLEHRVALDEALLLAADASGDARMIESVRRLAQAVRDGRPLHENVAGLPPILTWLLATQPHDATLLTAARHAAEGYSWQASHQAEKIRLFFPVLATICVAGLVTLLYSLTLYVPWSNLLRSLAN
jgi:general secretion pathway protein F